MAPVTVMLGVVVVAILCIAAVAATAWLAYQRTLTAERAGSTGRLELPRPGPSRIESEGTGSESASPGTYDRTVRVLILIFLASIGVAVFATDTYQKFAVQIELVIAAALLTTVLLQDVIPIRGPGRLRRWIEAVAAIVYVALLTAFTGGASSPFFVGFLLIVAGASLLQDELAPALLAVLSGAFFSLVVVFQTSSDAFLNTLPALAFDLVVLALLAYLATVVAREQRRAHDAALSLSRFDPLTNLFNRSFFFSQLDRELRRSARSGTRFALLMFDLDRLKPVNDEYGHPVGDALIKAVADAVRRNVRSTDVAARYGGDEFILLLADTDATGASTVAEKLRTDISAVSVGPVDRPASTSASFGLVSYPDDGTTIESLIQNADDALLQSKRDGKDRITGYVTRTERVATPVSRGEFLDAQTAAATAATTAAAATAATAAADGTNGTDGTAATSPPATAPTPATTATPRRAPVDAAAWDSTATYR